MCMLTRMHKHTQISYTTYTQTKLWGAEKFSIQLTSQNLTKQQNFLKPT